MANRDFEGYTTQEMSYLRNDINLINERLTDAEMSILHQGKSMKTFIFLLGAFEVINLLIIFFIKK